MATLRLAGIEKRFGDRPVIRGLDLDVADGEFVAVLGPSGCGKSTLLRMIAGLETLSAGDILLDGQSLRGIPPEQRNIAMVFQSYALYPHMTAAENMTFSLRLRGAGRAERRRRASEIARILELEAHLDSYPARLSGGQRQRVAIGRAMVRNPGVFLFDEPLSNLDSRLRHEMRSELKRLHQKLGATMIYITHDQVEAMTLADRIVVMREGQIEQVGTPSEIFERPATTYVAGFVGTPEMNMLEGILRGGDLLVPQFGLVVPNIGRQLPETEVVVGLRPDALVPAGPEPDPTGQGVRLSLPVTMVEPLGSENIVSLAADGTEIRMRVFGPTPARKGAEVAFQFVPQALHLFERHSGRRLPAVPAG